MKSRIIAGLVFLLLTAFLISCGGAQTVEVTRMVEGEEVVVTRIVEGEAVEVTRVETVERVVEVTPTPGGIPQGGTFRMALQAEPIPLNPIISFETSQNMVNNILFDGLTRPDAETLSPSPNLATDWEVSEDGLEWTFFLRDDVTWHDGTPFTAEDVKFTFDAVTDPEVNSPDAADFANLVEVEVIDETTVKFVLDSPNADFASLLSIRNQIAPKHLLDGLDINNATEYNTERPIGTGPFKVVEFTPGSEYVFEANPDYHHGAPHLDRFVIKVLPDVNTQIAQLATGELDMVFLLAPTNIPAVLGRPGLTVDRAPIGYLRFIDLNNQKEFFSDPLVRQALIYGLDRQLIIDQVANGLAAQATGVVPPAVGWAYNPDLEPIPYDPEMARQLLTEAGWEDTDGDGIRDKDGVPFSVTLLVDRGNLLHEQMGLVAQQQWNELGLEIEYLLAERGGQWLEETRARTFDMRTAGRGIIFPDQMYRFYHSEGPSNASSYNNAVVDEALEQGRVTQDQDERQEWYWRMQEEMQQDPPFVYILHPEELRGRNENLKGVLTTAEFRYAMIYSYQWYLDE